nr:hypothetical protein [Methylomarinum sp. Ch1-1]MDP4519642.1 hypothetical protein [Methylomarinum sp. Ch1-1]
MALFAPRAALLRKASCCLRMLNSVKRIKKRCASYRQHTLPTSVRWITAQRIGEKHSMHAGRVI